MPMSGDGRATTKRKSVIQAATELFLERGFERTTMDDVAALAGVSKPTLYRYFEDKDRLYAAIVQATSDDVDQLVRVVAAETVASAELDEVLRRLAGELLSTLMRPDVLRLRRLVIAQAEKFPAVGRDWFTQGFERVLDTLASTLKRYADQGKLHLDDPLLAANHFVGLLLWIPLNRAMFCAETVSEPAQLERYAKAAVVAFLNGYQTRPKAKHSAG